MTTTKTERGGLLNRIIEFSLRNRLLVTFAIILASILGLIGAPVPTRSDTTPAVALR